jgi:Delta7-sterol 5-desaturase
MQFLLNSPQQFLTLFLIFTCIVILRYFLINFIWIFLDRSKNKHSSVFLKQKYLYPKDPLRAQKIFEIKWSLITAFIFGITGVIVLWLWQKNFTQIYLQIDQFGYVYLILSWFLMSVIQDFYFYITHFLLHQPWFYKKFHQIHHESLHPTVWASFSFHPVEALIQAVILPLIILFLPLHPLILVLHLTLMTITAAINHGGYELYPQWMHHSFFTRNLIGATHHSLHHRYYRYNYGLFYNWWDILFKTEKK